MTRSRAPRQWRYMLHGLSVTSNARLAFLQPSECRSDPDIHLELADSAVPAPLLPSQVTYSVTPPGRSSAFISVGPKDDGYLVRIDGCGDFSINRQGTRIACVPVPGCPRATIEQLLVDQVIPHVMQLQGRLCLHASAAALAGRVVGFLGPAGSGKSTMTAALCERQATLVTDDGLAVAAASDEICVYPGYPSVRLWPDSADAIFDDPSQFSPASPRTSKLRVVGQGASGQLPLAALFFLDPSPTGAVTAGKLDGTEAFSVLVSSVHRLIDDEPRLLEEELKVLSDLAARVPVYRLTYPRRFESLDEMVALVADLVAPSSGAD